MTLDVVFHLACLGVHSIHSPVENEEVNATAPWEVTKDGVVYQKDLGGKTDVRAKTMKEFDCNPSWQKAEEQPEEAALEQKAK